MDIRVDDTLLMKSSIPGGVQTSQLVLRIGADFKLRCEGEREAANWRAGVSERQRDNQAGNGGRRMTCRYTTEI